MFQNIMNKCQRKKNGQSTIDNPEKQTTMGTIHRVKTQKKTKTQKSKTMSNTGLKPGVDPGASLG